MFSTINITGICYVVGAICQSVILTDVFAGLSIWVAIVVTLVPWVLVFGITFTNMSIVSRAQFVWCLKFSMGYYLAFCFISEVSNLVFGNSDVITSSDIVVRGVMYSVLISFIVYIKAIKRILTSS